MPWSIDRSPWQTSKFFLLNHFQLFTWFLLIALYIDYCGTYVYFHHFDSYKQDCFPLIRQLSIKFLNWVTRRIHHVLTWPLIWRLNLNIDLTLGLRWPELCVGLLRLTSTCILYKSMLLAVLEHEQSMLSERRCFWVESKSSVYIFDVIREALTNLEVWRLLKYLYN